GLGRRPAGDRAHAAGKRCHQRQSRPSVFRHYSSVGGREGACLAATVSWTARSLRIAHAELRRLKTVPGLGPAPRRSALRKNRRVARAERRDFSQVKIENFFSELKRRNVIRMAGLYLVGAWLVVQVAGTVLPMFGVPE